MKVKVDQEACISCALCVDTCPMVFSFNDDNKSEAERKNVEQENEENVKLAAYECPTNAILVEE